MQDEIIRIAREAGFSFETGQDLRDNIPSLERFAALVAAHERKKQAEQEPVAWVDLTKEELHQIEMTCETSAECYRVIAKALKDRNYTAPMRQHSKHYWLHEINNARADGYERGYAAGKNADTVKQEPVAFTNKEQLGYLKDPRYQAAPMAMWSKPFDKRINVSLYAAPVRTKDLTNAHILVLWQETANPDAHRIERFARAVIAADREKNK